MSRPSVHQQSAIRYTLGVLLAFGALSRLSGAIARGHLAAALGRRFAAG